MTEPKGSQVCLSFTREERLELQKRFELPVDVRQQLYVVGARVAEIWMSREQADNLREQAADLLQLHGLADDDKLSDEGRLLEKLIDKLFVH